LKGPVIESLACATPDITSKRERNFHGRNYLKVKPYLFEPFSVDELMEQMISIINDKELKK
jgi:nitrogen regulatory protein PII-like uncharacterized protein